MVNSINLNSLQEIVNSGKANHIIKKDGTRIILKYAMTGRGTTLVYGDIILRKNEKNEIQEINPFCITYSGNGESAFGNSCDGGNSRDGGNTSILKPQDRIRKVSGEIIPVVPFTKKPYKINVGDTVERQLKNGDYVLFNRQPTLHTGSMIAKRVIIRPGKTLRFNLASCKSFGADKHFIVRKK